MDRMQRSLIASAAIAVIGMLTASSTSCAQAPQVAPPSLSKPMKQYFQDHPEEWQKFLSQLADQRQQAAQTSAGTVQTTAPAGGAWTAVTGVNKPNVALTQPQLMTDGSVLFNTFCAGGLWYKLTPTNVGSYSNGTWTQIATLPVINNVQYAPIWYGMQVLPDGRLIINGGEYNYSGVGGNCTNSDPFTTKGAIYDLVANTWTAVAPPPGWSQIGDAQSIVLADGTYMLANSQSVQQARLNLGNMTWSATGTGKADGNDEEGWTLLPNGKVLTVDVACGNNSELYNPATGAWSTGGSTIVQLPDCTGVQSFELGPQLLRPDGTVIAFGGTTTNASAHTAIYATSSGTWTQGPDVLSTCGAQNNGPCTLADSGAALLSNGSVLFAAAPANWPTRGSFLPGTHFFELSPSNGYTQVSDPPNASSDPSYVNNLVVLPTGDILRTNLSSNVFIYTPTDKTFNSSWQPVVTSVPSCVSPNGTYTASGTQFNGLSQGSAYGDDYQSDTNFPLVRIELNGHKYYARTFNHSSRSIATGAAGSTSFQVASATELGAATLYVVANGIPSAGTAVTISTSCGGGGSMVATHDFSGDSKSDISWRQNTGAAAVWLMNGAQVTQSVGFGTVANSWVVVGQRDFDGNGKHDWLWRDSGGNAAIWFLNGTQISSTASLGAIATNWAIVGTGDFNGDGKGDILWRDSQTGTVAIWLMNGSQVAQSAGLGAVPSNWVIAAAGDFNGDGKYDILWRDSQTGTVAIWLLNGTQVIQSASLGAVPSNWSISDVGDFNGDGKWDILWRDSSGAVAIWFLNGTQVSSSVGVTTVSTAWTIWLTGDYNGDGKSDLLWKDTSGNVAMWFMNGAQVASSVGISNVGTSWSINWIGAE